MGWPVQLRSEWSALGAFARIGWRRAAAEPLATAARGGLNVLVLGIFWAFWRATPLAELRRPDLTPERLIWYLAVTEWLVFSTGIPYREIEEDIRSGALATSLTRPLGYAHACFAQWCGGMAFRLPIFAVVGFAAALGFSGTVPIVPAMLVVGLMSVVLALTILHLCHLMIGLATIWTGSAAPVHWIWQKGLFVLGGLIIPLSLYPTPLRRLSENSPFAAMLSAPASLALDPSPGHAIAVLKLQSIWLIVLAAMAWLIDRAAITRLLERGA
jgi:ABC-2 type transport system permease protein